MRTLNQLIQFEIKSRLYQFNFNVSKVAKTLEIGRSTIYRHVKASTIQQMRLDHERAIKNKPEAFDGDFNDCQPDEYKEEVYTEGQQIEKKYCNTCYGYNNPNCPECN